MMHNNSGAMSDDASSGSNGSNGGGGGGNGGVMLKKGPWTAAEDAILIEYVQQHGEGNWNAVQKNSGLSRCGKSCRLRWANHLRPNLKKGSFSPEEERLILELHAKLGNKWARMAAQLPGRTDNEIKNYWNTRVKRRQRAGLPLYPQDIQKHPSSFSFHHHNNNQHHQSRTSQSSIPLSSPSSSPHPKSNFLTPMTSMFEPVNFSSGTPFLSPPNSSNSYLSLPVQGGFKRFRTNNSFSSFSTQTPPLSSSSLFNSPSFSSLFPSSNFQFDSNTIDFSAPNMLQNSYDSNGLISSGGSTYSVKTELPSNQMLPTSTGLQSGNAKPGPSLTRTNSGLLDALLQEAEEMSGKEHHRQDSLMYKGGALDEFLNCTPHHQGSVFSNNNTTPPIGGGSPWDEDSTAQSSGAAVKKEPSLDINNAVEEDDDLSSLLNSIPAAMMVSDLYRRDGAETSNGQSSSVTDEDIGLDARHLPSTTVAATNSSIEPEWSLGAWNDLSGMSC